MFESHKKESILTYRVYFFEDQYTLFKSYEARTLHLECHTPVGHGTLLHVSPCLASRVPF